MKSRSAVAGGGLWAVAILCAIAAVIALLVHDSLRSAIGIGIVGLVFALLAASTARRRSSA